MLAWLLVLATLVIVAPEGLTAFHGDLPLCTEEGEGVHQQASARDRDTAVEFHATCCTGAQCTASQGGILPAAAALPDVTGHSVRQGTGSMPLAGTEPYPGRRPPRPVG